MQEIAFLSFGNAFMEAILLCLGLSRLILHYILLYNPLFLNVTRKIAEL